MIIDAFEPVRVPIWNSKIFALRFFVQMQLYVSSPLNIYKCWLEFIFGTVEVYSLPLRSTKYQKLFRVHLVLDTFHGVCLKRRMILVHYGWLVNSHVLPVARHPIWIATKYCMRPIRLWNRKKGQGFSMRSDWKCCAVGHLHWRACRIIAERYRHFPWASLIIVRLQYKSIRKASL